MGNCYGKDYSSKKSKPKMCCKYHYFPIDNISPDSSLSYNSPNLSGDSISFEGRVNQNRNESEDAGDDNSDVYDIYAIEKPQENDDDQQLYLAFYDDADISFGSGSKYSSSVVETCSWEENARECELDDLLYECCLEIIDNE